MNNFTSNKEKLNTTLSEAYDYISNVLKCQRRVLSLDDMYSGYKSMRFQPELSATIFEDYYYQIICDWEHCDECFIAIKIEE